MFVLLSSDYSPRYKQDILRCLAAPVGTDIQFRYDRVHLSESVLKQIGKLKYPASAVVCSVATKGVGPLTLVLVRSVDIVALREHGSTVSVILRMREVANAEPASFTAALDSSSNGESPRKTSEGAPPEGKYFFEIPDLPIVERGSSLTLWEKAITNLRTQHAYQDEPFFWTTVGIQEEGQSLDASTLHALPDKLLPGKGFDLLIYHYQPRGGARPNSKLELSVGPDIEIVVPPDLTVDSRYDLKIWSCRITANTQSSQKSWFRVKASDAWELDVAVIVAGAWKRWMARALVTGVLIAVPSILALVPQSIPQDQKYAYYGMAVLFGFFAGLVATYKIERLD
jgi:hypothetical protein